MNVSFICKFFTISGAINLQPQPYQSLHVSLASLLLPNFEKDKLWTSIAPPEPLNLFKVPLQCTLIDFFYLQGHYGWLTLTKSTKFKRRKKPLWRLLSYMWGSLIMFLLTKGWIYNFLFGWVSLVAIEPSLMTASRRSAVTPLQTLFYQGSLQAYPQACHFGNIPSQLDCLISSKVLEYNSSIWTIPVLTQTLCKFILYPCPP